MFADKTRPDKNSRTNHSAEKNKDKAKQLLSLISKHALMEVKKGTKEKVCPAYI